jgi:hypothetical protein
MDVFSEGNAVTMISFEPLGRDGSAAGVEGAALLVEEVSCAEAGEAHVDRPSRRLSVHRVVDGRRLLGGLQSVK